MRDPLKRILLLYTSRESTPFREHVTRDQLARMAKALNSDGWIPTVAKYASAGLDRILATHRPDVVFNLAYGYFDRKAGIKESQPDIVARLEARRLHIVGSPASAQRVAQDKLACATLLRKHGIVSPRTVHPSRRQSLPELVVVKPRYGACHRDVALIDPRQLRARSVKHDMLIQEYVHGTEITIGILQLRKRLLVLPTIEIRFEREDIPHLMVPGRLQWDLIIHREDVFAVSTLARRCFRYLGLRDYGRFDFRITSRGPILLDANALPNLDPMRSYFPLSAAAAGIEYEKLILLLAESARMRARRGKDREIPMHKEILLITDDALAAINSKTIV